MSSPFNRPIFRNEERSRAVPDVAVDAVLDLRQMELEHIKVFQFMWYQAFRCPRKHEKGSPAQRQGFDLTEYLSLKEKYSQSDPAAKIDDPQNGIGISCMAQYKTAILHLWRDQIHRGVNNRSRDEVWQNSSDALMNMVKSRKHRINKKNYAEKVDEVSAPYALIQQHKEIESSFFASDCTGINRQVFSTLRNRFCFLMITFAILRGESMFKAELSDLYGVQVQTPDDPHPIYVMMMQISTDKTNQDLKLFGRAARHKKNLLCPVGALAFYLLYRFSQTGEFESIDDFTKNDRWFDTKLLVDLQQRTNDLSRVISDKTYSDAVKKICKQLGIPTQHYVHLGRVLGSVLAEADGDDNELIRILGNWDPKIQEKAYSSKLPMKIIRSRAGFRSNGGVHYNARTIVQPPSELLSQVFPWVDRATQELNAFLQSSPAEACPFAAVFLDFMMKLKVVVLQDAAATMVLHPERSVHQLFQLDVFKSDCFKAYVEQMRQQLAVAEDPSDVTLQAVIPPVVDRLNVLSQQGERNCQATNEVSNQIRTGFDSVHVGHNLILQSISH
ncbi:centromere DNA-binding like protein [Nitzschia inconspicua]|uniref:Centromere DNA-binding like protein n=1 Tax=Nitzschia inconspicua TaxID=303405 RepID=A0A9K3PFE9_9STRA|nr:centromere DNA-binding like protein [Nitzschia inconspicua]